LTLDGRDKRRSLIDGTSKLLKCLLNSLFILNGTMKAENADVFLTSSLLGLDKTSSTINTNEKITSNLGIEGTTVTSLLDTENATNPGDDFMTTGIGGLIKIENTVSVGEKKHKKEEEMGLENVKK
jgi:hypothetical protein